MSLAESRVLVTPTSYAQYDDRLREELEQQVGEVVYNTTGQALSSHDLIELIPDFDGFIAGVDEIDRPVIEAARRLKAIARYGVGVDNIDLDAAREHGIIVTNTPSANSGSVAELAITFMLALARDLVPTATGTRAGAWPQVRGVSLEGKTVGLVGFGSVGKEVARRLLGFGCTVLAFDVVEDQAFAQDHDVQLCDIQELLARSDFVSLHCPLLPETRGLVDAAFLDRMKTGAFLVNTARGGLIDPEAVLDALHSGTLRGVALDVFTEEPPPPDDPLLNHPGVIATPHMAAHTDRAATAMGWGALHNCLAVLRGEPPPNRVV